MAIRIIKFLIRFVIDILPASIRGYAYSVIQYKDFGGTCDPVLQSKITGLIKKSVSNTNTSNFEISEDYLLKAAKLCPCDPRIAPHLGRVRFMKSRSLNATNQEETKAMLDLIDSMNEEIRSNPIYVPSEFWDTYGKFHIQLLEKYGIENFKRTVSHNYQNWYMTSKGDAQVRQLLNTWPGNFSVEPWLTTIEVPDHVGLHLDLNFENPINPLAIPEQREVYRVAVGLLWEYVRNTDHSGQFSQLTESEIGNPVRVWRKGHLISSDLAHSFREKDMLLGELSLDGDENYVVGELGAGHGRLAEIFGLTTNYRYYIFDITPALYVSQWYIKQRFPDEKIFEFRHFDDFNDIKDELQECRFAFFTNNQIEKIPDDSVELFVNMNSLMEMHIDQIDNYLHQIDRLTTDAFLSRQWFQWENTLDNIKVTKDVFTMPERWRLALDKTDDIFPEFFNQIWKRTKTGGG